MKTKLFITTIVAAFAFSAQARISCKVLMNTFEESGKKTVYDLNDSEQEKYNSCLEDMKLLPNSYKEFETRTEEEARKRKDEYAARERSAKEVEKQKEISKTREEYTFSRAELESLFNKPVYGYRFVTRDRFTDGMSHKHYAMQRLTDINELCKAIGKEHDIKGMKAVDAHMHLSEAHRERDNLNDKGIVIPDTFWFWEEDYKNFETSKDDRNKMRRKGANKFKILEFSEVTCVTNENKDDSFSDLAPKVTLHTKTKKFTSILENEKDEVYTIGEELEVGEDDRGDSIGANGNRRRGTPISQDAYLNDLLEGDRDVRKDIGGFTR
jgi:hypothetical protein